ncbi:hypothetical protein JTB14_001149 [Gonioctena quinquepunctata]|nr:hypothetical protein JTB14_001149 [Gonioctena quinquepunctata]
MFSSSLDEENLADISTEKKITQDTGNAKKRKTGKTHETIEIDRDYQKIDKPAEKPRKKKQQGKARNQPNRNNKYITEPCPSIISEARRL